MKINSILCLFFLFFSRHVLAQNYWDPLAKAKKSYITWGYNRTGYNLSTIQLDGPGYDFTLKNVLAADRPSKFDPSVYFSITQLSIPQFNFRAGYFLNDNWAVTFGYDHMKYVVEEDQFVTITGYIDSSATSIYAGNYNDDQIQLHQNFILYEHTDGLNYISGDVEYHDNFIDAFNHKLSLDFYFGIGLGVIVPKTRAVIFNTRGNDTYHLAGVGSSMNFGSRVYLWKHVFVQAGIKRGYIYLPDVATNGHESDRAKQSIHFWERYFQLGYLFKI